MKLTTALVCLAGVAEVAVANSWFKKAPYNKWHETELERWLSDNNIPYPTPADRKDLEQLISKNWDSYVVAPYSRWSPEQLSAYLKQRGIETQQSAAESKDSLIGQVKEQWYETSESAETAWGSVKDWILDSWTESQLKAFCDKHGIPVPQPRKRDTLLQKAREAYSTVAEKLGEAYAYPGNWLYETWSESDLKEWLDKNGYPAPQPTTRDSLIASVRRNSRLAYLKSQEMTASASASAAAAYQTLTDTIIDAWSESQLKEFADKNGINVPQGTKVNQLRALVRKHRAEFLGDTVSASAASAYGAATSNVGNQYAQATDGAAQTSQQAFDAVVNTWSESRLKAYLDARGVPVPHASKTDELRALVRKHGHKAASGYTAWTFDDFSVDTLKKYLASSGNEAAKKTSEKAGATREELISAANSAYTSASSAGGNTYASATNYLAQATNAVRKSAFDAWSESELKSYLDSYGFNVPQGSTVNELRAYARKQATYFKYGTSTPSGTVLAKLEERVGETVQWIKDLLNIGGAEAKKQGYRAEKKVHEEL